MHEVKKMSPSRRLEAVKQLRSVTDHLAQMLHSPDFDIEDTMNSFDTGVRNLQPTNVIRLKVKVYIMS